MNMVGQSVLTLVVFGCFLLQNLAQADILETSEPAQIFHGRLESESEREVVFQVRHYAGEIESRSFEKSNVKQLIVTIDQNDLAAFSTWDAKRQFEYCETLAASNKDLEIEWSMDQLLSVMQQRHLEPELRLAVDRLLANAVSVGPALFKLRERSIEQSGARVNQHHGDWQLELIRRLAVEDQERLRKIVVHCRQQKQWNGEWKELRQRIQFISSPDALERLELLLLEIKSSAGDLLRLELLLSGVNVDQLGPPLWPNK